VSVITGDLRRKEFRHHIAMSIFDATKSLNEGAFHIMIITFCYRSGPVGQYFIERYPCLFNPVCRHRQSAREIHRIVDEAHESGIKARKFFAMLDQPRDHSFNVAEPQPLNWGRTLSSRRMRSP